MKLLPSYVENGESENDSSFQIAASAVRDLPLANTRKAAEILYWNIDNNVIVQGKISPKVKLLFLPLIDSLRYATEFGRAKIFDLIFQLMNGNLEFASPNEQESFRQEVILFTESCTIVIFASVCFGEEDFHEAADLLSLLLQYDPKTLPLFKEYANYAELDPKRISLINRIADNIL